MKNPGRFSFDDIARGVLGLGVPIAGIVAVTILAWRLQEENAQLVLTAVLPLVGTWVGTVLAFYFSKDNFKAASDATVDLVERTGLAAILSKAAVREFMVKRSEMHIVTLDENDVDGSSKKLENIVQIFDMTQNWSRAPILLHDGAIKAIIHRSTFREFENTAYRNGENADAIKAKPIATLLGDTQVQGVLAYSIAFVAVDDTVGTAKDAMEANGPNCQDVIVTKTGKPTEPVIGWLTNVEIQKASKAT